MGTSVLISQRLNERASPMVIGGMTYAQYVVPPIHGRLGTIHSLSATFNGLQQRILTSETSWPEFGTLPIHSCYGGDHTPTQHNRNDG